MHLVLPIAGEFAFLCNSPLQSNCDGDEDDNSKLFVRLFELQRNLHAADTTMRLSRTQENRNLLIRIKQCLINRRSEE